jgi:arylsulfatase A-like enzyme
MSNRPNVLLFFTDDQRFDTIQALGNRQIHTPNLDKLVARGTVFTRAHIPGGTSAAVCMPSRAMLHTGRTLFHLQNEGQEIPENHTTLGECFKNEGYTTYGIGKWHNGRKGYARSFSDGDEIFFPGMGDHWNVAAYRYDPSGKYEGKIPFVRDPFSSNEVEYKECDHITAGKHSTDLFCDASIDFLEAQDGATPFFLYTSLMAPHDPRTMPNEFLKLYDPSTIDLPKNFQEEHLIDTGALKIRDELLAAFPRDPNEIKKHIAEYYAMISHLDDAFGKIIETMEKKGLLENTIVVFAGDNGLALGQHGLMGKQNLYDHSVRVPLIFAGPGIPQGKKIDSLSYLLDIFPTLCDLTKTTKPQSIEGRSLAPCFENGKIRDSEALYLAYGKSIRGITDGEYKLIEYACGESQLFNLPQDPLEMHNLAKDHSSEPLLIKMREQLIQLKNEWDDAEHPTGHDFWKMRPDLESLEN